MESPCVRQISQTCSFRRHPKKKHERFFQKHLLHFKKTMNKEVRVSTDYSENAGTIMQELGYIGCADLSEFRLASNLANISSGGQS